MATLSLNQKFSSDSPSQDDSISESKKSKNLKNVRLVQTSLKEAQDQSSYPIESLTRDDETLGHQSDDETNYESNGSSSPANADLRPSSSFISSLDDFIPTGLSTEVELDGPEREFFMRTVVIGTQSAGKSSLINSCFVNTEDGSAQNPQERPQVDLLMRTATNFNDTKKYHFWMRTLHRDDSEIKEILWKTYYKWATAFVFVYDITSQESFKALERAVRSVQSVIPKDNFFGILVGTKSDLAADQREVTSEEALEFKQRHSFMYFIETSSNTEGSTPQLLPRLDTKLKLTFEAI